MSNIYGSVVGGIIAGNISGSGEGGGGNIKCFSVNLSGAGQLAGVYKFAYEDGMTWSQFISSDYNTIVYTNEVWKLFDVTQEGNVGYLQGDVYVGVEIPDGQVESTDVISDSIEYLVDYA